MYKGVTFPGDHIGSPLQIVSWSLPFGVCFGENRCSRPRSAPLVGGARSCKQLHVVARKRPSRTRNPLSHPIMGCPPVGGTRSCKQLRFRLPSTTTSHSHPHGAGAMGLVCAKRLCTTSSVNASKGIDTFSIPRRRRWVRSLTGLVGYGLVCANGLVFPGAPRTNHPTPQRPRDRL